MIKKILWALLVLLLAAAVMFYLDREQWVADFNQERQAQQSEFIQQGQAFGESANQQQCLAQSLEKLGSCFSYGCTLDHGAYLRACLQEASPSEQFCQDVPSYHKKATEDDKSWLKDNCWDKNLNGESCRFLYKQQIHFCSVK